MAVSAKLAIVSINPVDVTTEFGLVSTEFGAELDGVWAGDLQPWAEFGQMSLISVLHFECLLGSIGFGRWPPNRHPEPCVPWDP